MIRRLLIAVAVLLFALPAGSSQPATAGADRPMLFTGAWLIDGTGAAAVDNAWVRIQGGKIAAVGRGAPPPADGATVVDVKGKTIVPGLADMHVHLGPLDQAKWMLKLLAAHGVTNVKDAGNTLGNLAGIRKWAATDPALPHLYVSGVTMNGSEQQLQFLPAGPRTRALLEDNLAFGVDFLKIHNWVSSFALKQISEFATAHNLYLTGHVPLSVSSVGAIEAGMKILEHVRVHPYEILDEPPGVAEYPLDLVVMRRTGAWALFKPDGRAVTRTLDEWEKRKDRFFIDPTLAVQEALARSDEPAVKDGADLRLISPAMRQNWPAGTRQYGELSAAEFARAKGSVQGMTAFVGLAHKRGIRILSGTDTPVPYTIPGVSLLRELELLVKAGLTPVEAIRASTGTAADAFRNKTRGLIAAGQEADLLIVDGNVAADIAATKHIERVVIGGRVYERARLLEDAARLAAAHQGRSFPGNIH